MRVMEAKLDETRQKNLIRARYGIKALRIKQNLLAVPVCGSGEGVFGCESRRASVSSTVVSPNAESRETQKVTVN